MSRKLLTDEELDALVVRSLSRLPAHAPSRAFENKVMCRVQLPQPRPVTLYRRARTWVAQPRRAVALACIYALAASVALVVAIPWLLNNSPAIRFAFDWTVTRSVGGIRQAALGLASWTVSSGITGLVKSIPLTGGQLWAAAFALTAGYAGCAIGLHFLLRAPRGKDDPVRIQG